MTDTTNPTPPAEPVAANDEELAMHRKRISDATRAWFPESAADQEFFAEYQRLFNRLDAEIAARKAAECKLAASEAQSEKLSKLICRITLSGREPSEQDWLDIQAEWMNDPQYVEETARAISTIAAEIADTGAEKADGGRGGSSAD